MKMRCQNNLDERQLLLRGNVFQHGFILLVAALGVNAFLKDQGIVWAEGMWENILIVWAAITLCFCEFIFLEIYPMGTGQSTFYIILGITGLFLMGFSIFHFAVGDEVFLTGRTVTSQGAMSIEAALMLLIFLTYVGRTIYKKRKGLQNEEEE